VTDAKALRRIQHQYAMRIVWTAAAVVI